LLLSEKAYQTDPNFNSLDSLLNALGQSPQIVTELRAFSPDGKFLAVENCGNAQATSQDCPQAQIVVWNVTSRKIVGSLTLGQFIPSDFAFSRDGKLLAINGCINDNIIYAHAAP
jgi:ribosomal protein S27E